jgi:isocitrate dehydrogenase
MVTFDKLTPPDSGTRITVEGDELDVPDDPIIPFIQGDGIGPDIWNAAEPVLEAAVEAAYGGDLSLGWFRVYAGEDADERYGEHLPKDTLQAFEHYVVGIKGPLTTPVGGGFRSLNVAIRQALDLYACVRPVKYIPGVSAPVKDPEETDMVIFRENTEDVYSGVEYEAGSREAGSLKAHVEEEYGAQIQGDNVGIGVKPISEEASKRLVRKAIDFALDRNRDSVTLVHKGNIMKYTEGAFREWGYEVAGEEYPQRTTTWEEVEEEHGGEVPDDQVVVWDKIADNMLQQIITRTSDYDVIATMNLNGDYISDAAAGMVAGLGIAPGGNVGDHRAVFEATHGTAPKYAGMDKVNPTSLILSGKMMLEHLGWYEAAELVEEGVEETIGNEIVTYDVARGLEGVEPVATSEYGQAIADNIRGRRT